VLIKVTSRCSMGCSHCLDEAGPDGTDMTAETFLKALDFAAQIEAASPIRATLLSGGEPTDNPSSSTSLTRPSPGSNSSCS
jgi:molybdenum cofactor biosynthesis enzyme MoaA